MLQLPVTDSRCANDNRTICNGFCDTLIFLRVGQQLRRPDRRTSLAKRRVVGIDDAQMMKSKVAHRARGCADIKRIARSHQYHAKTIEFIRGSRQWLFALDTPWELNSERGICFAVYRL